MSDVWKGHCGRGICAAELGHEGTCADASGWADEPIVETVRALSAADRVIRRIVHLDRAPLLWTGDQA